MEVFCLQMTLLCLQNGKDLQKWVNEFNIACERGKLKLNVDKGNTV